MNRTANSSVLLTMFLAACGAPTSAPTPEGMTALSAFEVQVNPSEGTMNIAQHQTQRGLVPVTVEQNGVPGVGPLETVELVTTMTARDLDGNGGCGIARTFCGDVTMRSFHTLPLNNVFVEITSITPPTNHDGRNSDPSQFGLVDTLGLWGYGSLTSGGSNNRLWAFGDDGLNYVVVGRVMADTNGQSCLSILQASPGATDGWYIIDRDGSGPQSATPVWCDMTTAGGGWTVIASQNTLYPDDLANHYDEQAPQPGVTGVFSYYFLNDLQTMANEIYVSNNLGQSTIFLTSSFDGPLILGGPNFLDAGTASWNGIIAGNTSPVVTHYQVGQYCGSASCRQSITSDSRYVYGTGVVFDWHNGDSSVNTNNHAHFGGTPYIETLWSSRGTLLMIR